MASAVHKNNNKNYLKNANKKKNCEMLRKYASHSTHTENISNNSKQFRLRMIKKKQTKNSEQK